MGAEDVITTCAQRQETAALKDGLLGSFGCTEILCFAGF